MKEPLILRERVKRNVHGNNIVQSDKNVHNLCEQIKPTLSIRVRYNFHFLFQKKNMLTQWDIFRYQFHQTQMERIKIEVQLLDSDFCQEIM